jgi:hypothetical protein
MAWDDMPLLTELGSPVKLDYKHAAPDGAFAERPARRPWWQAGDDPEGLIWLRKSATLAA